MLPAVLVMAEGGSTDWEELQGTNWDEELEKHRTFARASGRQNINTGGAAIDPMRISTISYTNYFQRCRQRFMNFLELFCHDFYCVEDC